MSETPDNLPNAEERPAPDEAASSTADSVSTVLGDFELRREIGRGGMGTVYEAWQRSLKRTVAVKVLSGAVSASQSAVVRFQREAQAAAKLHHAHIVPIFALGEEQGTYYYAMELVDGPGLNAVITEARERQTADTASADLAETVPLSRPSQDGEVSATAPETQPVVSRSHVRDSASRLPEIRSSEEHFNEVAQHMALVADALDYAHAQGVIHRDIKPHNLILSSDGKLLISDFGLARLVEQPGVTVTGELIGSPLYMSPEQLSGDPGQVDHRADICSLGATMYEWLTLTPPYPGETREQVISKILTSEPPLLRAHNPSIPVDLETVCLKAVERDPNRRYQTAGELRDDLNRFIASQPIKAKRASLPTRIGRLVGRHPVMSLAAGAMLVALVLGWALVAMQREVRTQTAVAEQEKQQTDKILNYLDALPLEIGGPLMVAEKAVPYLASEGADPNAAGTPVGIARRAALDFYEDISARTERISTRTEQDEVLGFLDEAIALSRTDPEAASRIARAVVEARPDSPEARRLDASLCGRLGQHERMSEDAEALVRLRADEPDSYAWRSMSHLLLNRNEEGLADLDHAIEMGGTSAWFLTFRGLVLARAERVIEANAAFDDALALNSDLIVALLGRASGRAALGNMTGALVDLTHVLELEPDNADVLALRGDRYVELGDFEAAERDYERAMEIAGRTTLMIVRYLSAISQRRNILRGNTPHSEAPNRSDVGADAAKPTRQPSAGFLQDWLTRLRSGRLRDQDEGQAATGLLDHGLRLGHLRIR